MKDQKIKYEVVVVFSPKAEEKFCKEIIKKLGEALVGQGAKLVSKDHLGVKPLVYEIKKNDKGDFWVLEFLADVGLKLSEINLMLNRESKIIRYLVLKI